MSKKITNTNLAGMIAEVVANPPQSEPTHIRHYRNEQEAIIRQSCLKSAVHLMESKVNGKTNMQNATAMTLEIAEAFENWVKR
jgi:hypothetical protein